MQNRLVSANIYYGEHERLPYEDSMKVAFRATIGDVTPIFILIQLPQLCEPIQHTYLVVAWSGHRSCFQWTDPLGCWWKSAAAVTELRNLSPGCKDIL